MFSTLLKVSLHPRQVSLCVRQYVKTARKFSQTTVHKKLKETNDDNVDNEKEGAALREEVYLLTCGLEGSKTVYEVKDTGRIVADLPAKDKNVLKLDRSMIENRLYERKQELFIRYMFGITKYVENYDQLKKEQEEHEKVRKIVEMQERTVHQLKSVNTFSGAMKVLSSVESQLETWTKVKVLSQLQKIVYKEFCQKIPVLAFQDSDCTVGAFSSKRLFNTLKKDQPFISFVRSIDKSKLTPLEFLQYLHALSLVFFIDEKELKATLERQILTDKFSPMYEEIDLLYDLIAWSSTNDGILRETFDENKLFEQFKRVVLEQNIDSEKLDLVLKLCIRFTPQIGLLDDADIFKETLIDKFKSVLQLKTPSTAINILLWNHAIEAAGKQGNFQQERIFLKQFIQPSVSFLTNEIKAEHFEILPQIFQYFGPSEKQNVQLMAKTLLADRNLSLQEIALCGKVCGSMNLLDRTLNAIEKMVSEADNVVFAQVLEHLGDEVWRRPTFQQAVSRKVISAAAYLIDSEIGMRGLYKYLLSVCAQKDTGGTWQQDCLLEVLSFYKDRIRAMPIGQLMLPSNQCIMFKLLLLIGRYLDLDIRNKMKLKDLSHSVVTGEGVDISLEEFLQLHKIFSKAGEAQDKNFLRWVVKSSLGLLVNKSKNNLKDKTTFKLDPEYLKLLLGSDRMVVNLFLDYFYDQICLEKDNNNSNGVMKSLVHKLVAVLDHVKLDISGDLMGRLLNTIPHDALEDSDRSTYAKMLQRLVSDRFQQLEIDNVHPDSEKFAEQYCKALQLLSKSIHASCSTDNLVKMVMSEDHTMMVFHVVAGSLDFYTVKNMLFQINRDACLLRPWLHIPWSQDINAERNIADLQKDSYKAIPEDLSIAVDYITEKPENVGKNVVVDYGICIWRCLLLNSDRKILRFHKNFHDAEEMGLERLALVYKDDQELDHFYNKTIDTGLLAPGDVYTNTLSSSSDVYLRALGFTVIEVKSYEWNSLAHGSLQDKIDMLRKKIFSGQLDSDISDPLQRVDHRKLSDHWKESLKIRPPTDESHGDFMHRKAHS